MLERIQAWRHCCPELAIRSTFIVGFPGETDEDFEQLLEFLDEAQLDRVGCFMYSPVEGASANQLPGQIPEPIKPQRYECFMQHQQKISAQKLQRKIGQKLQVIVDQTHSSGYLARSYAEAPEIDGLVYIETDQPLIAGQFYQVEITDRDEYDCYAKLFA